MRTHVGAAARERSSAKLLEKTFQEEKKTDFEMPRIADTRSTVMVGQK
jgi:hypothetical protein